MERRRDTVLMGLGGAFLLVGIIWFLYWILVGRFYIYTEDAYVAGNEVALVAQVEGYVKTIYADDTDLVEAGALLVDLDTTDYTLAFERSQEALAGKVREVSALFRRLEEKKALVELRQAEKRLATFDYTHREGLELDGSISVQEHENYKIALAKAEANEKMAIEELEEVKALTVNTTIETHPFVLEKVKDMEQSYINLLRCRVVAPARGYVAKRRVQVGEYASLGENLLTVVPLDYLWLEANYKETQASRLRINQEVEFTADLYGKSLTYHGKVVGFSAGTGSAFALLPPQNASGNWIKIVQRLPVRISIDPQELQDHPLFIGLSLRVSTDTHDTDAPRLAPCPRTTAAYATSIYEREREALEHLQQCIAKILRENV